jgi:hypothetical protein
MRKPHPLTLTAISILLVGTVCAATKPDFSGAWVLDKTRSFSNPAGLDQTMTVVQTGDELKLDAKVTTARDAERTIQESWTLDGVERDFSPPAPPGAKGKRKAFWLPGNRGIVVEEETTSTGEKGPVTQNVVRKWTLSRDGTTLTVDYHFDTPRGSGESKRVFTRTDTK